MNNATPAATETALLADICSLVEELENTSTKARCRFISAYRADLKLEIARLDRLVKAAA